MNALKVQVKNGRISIDEPTSLPEGTIEEKPPIIFAELVESTPSGL